MSENSTVSFWVSNLHDLNFTNFIPCSKASTEYNFNAVTVLTIYISVISAIASRSFIPLYSGIVFTGIIAMVYYFGYAPPEGMFNLMYPNQTNSNIGLQPILRQPSNNNPFMNVNITDYDKPQKYDNYNRYKEAVYPTPETEKIREEVKDNFTKGLFQDPNGRLFERQNSQREYVSQPVGSVPSKQNEFAQWLYGKKYTCKSGSIWDRYGVKSTPDSMVCTGFDAATPTNFGIKNA